MIKELEDVIKKGHFVLASGRHSGLFFNKREISADQRLLKLISNKIADLNIGTKVDFIISPEKGAVPFGKMATEYLNKKNQKVGFIRAYKRDNSELYLKNNESKRIRGKKIGIVEDVFTTGGSVQKIINLVEKSGAKIVFISGIVDRSNGMVSRKFAKFRFNTLEKLTTISWPADDCPLCKEGIPIDLNLGHGADLKANHPK